MNLGQAINAKLVRSRATIAPRESARPDIKLGRTWPRKAILDALTERPHTFGELRTVTRYRRDSQLSAMLSNLRRAGLVTQDGEPWHYRYRLAS